MTESIYDNLSPSRKEVPPPSDAKYFS